MAHCGALLAKTRPGTVSSVVQALELYRFRKTPLFVDVHEKLSRLPAVGIHHPSHARRPYASGRKLPLDSSWITPKGRVSAGRFARKWTTVSTRSGAAFIANGKSRKFTKILASRLKFSYVQLSLPREADTGCQ